MNRFPAALCAGLLLVGVACEGRITESDPPTGVPIDVELRRLMGPPYGPVPIGPVPAQSPALVSLGQALMFDKLLSGNKDISCATCHQPSLAAGDGLSLAIGTGGTGSGSGRTLGTGRQFGPRNAPTLLNKGLGLFYMFQDGRLQGHGGGFNFRPAGGVPLPAGLPNLLAAQAMFPVLSRQEMRGEPGDTDVLGNPNELAQFGDSQYTEIWRAVMQRVLAVPEYRTMFAAAFPGTPQSVLGFQHAATAIAAFQMQALTKTNSPFDRYLDRDDAALTLEEKRGALLFFGPKARCSSCHTGPFLGASGFENVGVPQVGPGTGSGAPLDFGFGDVIGSEFYRFAFRVAPLRNVELTAPYFHNGAYPTLETVVRHYNNVPVALRTYDVSQLDPALRDSYHGDAATIDAVLATLDFRIRTPLNLSDEEVGQLVAFLKSLTDPAARDLSAIAPLGVPSGLPVNE